MYSLEKVNPALQNLENHKVLLKDTVRPNEGPWLSMDPVKGSSCVPRVPWYDFWCLECKNMSNIANFLQRAYLSPSSRLIKDSETSAWWGLIQSSSSQFYFWLWLLLLATCFLHLFSYSLLLTYDICYLLPDMKKVIFVHKPIIVVEKCSQNQNVPLRREHVPSRQNLYGQPWRPMCFVAEK